MEHQASDDAISDWNCKVLDEANLDAVVDSQNVSLAGRNKKRWSLNDQAKILSVLAHDSCHPQPIAPLSYLASTENQPKRRGYCQDQTFPSAHTSQEYNREQVRLCISQMTVDGMYLPVSRKRCKLRRTRSAKEITYNELSSPCGKIDASMQSYTTK